MSAPMLLIYPPLAKACEPPAGIARLAGFLRSHGRDCTLLDANLEGQIHLLNHNVPGPDTWSRRAHRQLTANLEGMRHSELYKNPLRYQRAVSDLNRTLSPANRPDLGLSLANYQDNSLSPLQSSDLLKAADQPKTSIFHDYFAARLDGLLADHSPSLIGFSLNYLSQALTTFAMIGFLKQNYPALPIAAGGGLITSWLRNPAWQNPFTTLLNHLVAGPGEEELLRLLKNPSSPLTSANISGSRDSGGRSSLQWSKRAASTPKNHNIDSSPAAQPEPCPDYCDLPLADYLAPGLVLPYAASSGCYWQQCSFCPEKTENNPYHQVAPAVVLEHLEILKTRYNPALLHFLDNAISPGLMRALISRPPGLDWYSFARVGPDLADPAFCRALRRSGCVMLKLGLESGDQDVLDAMAKGIDLTMVAKVLANLEMAGIATYVYLLFGTPPESLNEARRTLAFAVKHSSAITFLNLAIFNMPLGSPEAADLAATSFYNADLSLYTDFTHPQGWQRREIRQFLAREFKRHPAITPIIQRDPPFFTSNHAPFLIP